MQLLIRFAFVGALGCAFHTSAQSLALKRLEETVGRPNSKPEPRRVISADPISLYRGLVSSSIEDRSNALRLLGHKEIDASESLSARLYAVHLDSRADLQYILVATGQPAQSIAMVFQGKGQEWWVIGDFKYWWHWDPNEAEQFIELREIVWYGRKEI